MMDEGLFADDKPDFVFGLHVDPALETGRVSLTPGTVLASSGAFIAKISASGSHAAFPHLTADTIVTASAVVTRSATRTYPSEKNHKRSSKEALIF